jgi:hypothetical protein
MRIEPRVGHRVCCGVCVRRDKDASSRRSGPQRPRVAWGPLDRSDKPTRAGRAAVGRYSQIGVSLRSDLDEVATRWRSTWCGELGTIGFEECLIAAPVLGSPDAL